MFTNPIRSREKTITVVGAPFALGQPRPGVDQGPEYLRRAGLIKELKEQGWHVEDSGDVSMQSATYVRTEAGDKTIQYGNGKQPGRRQPRRHGRNTELKPFQRHADC